MTQQSKAVIKANFETGDIPTEVQFADWIDSYHNLTDLGWLDGNSGLLTAVAPPVQATALQLTLLNNDIFIGDANGAAVKLTTNIKFREQNVYNQTGSRLFVFPDLAKKFKGYDFNEAVELQPFEAAKFRYTSDNIWTIDMMGTQSQTADEELIVGATTTAPEKADAPDIDAMFCKKTNLPKFLEFEYNYGKDGTQTGADDGLGQYLFQLPDGQKFVAPALGFYTSATDARTTNVGNFAIAGLAGYVSGANIESVVYVVPFDESNFRVILAAGNSPGQWINNVNFDTPDVDLVWRFKFVAEVIAKF